MTLSLGFAAFNENTALSELKELFSLVMHVLELSDWHKWGDRQLEAEWGVLKLVLTVSVRRPFLAC